MKKALALLLCMLLFSLCAQAEETTVSAPAPAQITAVGHGSAPVKADRAVLNLTVEVSNETAQAAESSAAAVQKALEDALSALGADPAVFTYEMEPLFDYNYGKLNGGSVPSGFRVRMDCTVRLDGLKSARVVIAAVLPLAPNSRYTLRFEPATRDEAYRAALAAAVEDACEKARLIGESCGLETGSILSMRELDTPAASAASAEASVEVIFHTLPSSK